MTEIKDTKKATPQSKKNTASPDIKTKAKKEPKKDLESKQDKARDQEQDQKAEHEQKKKQSTFDEFGNQVEKFAVKTAESIRRVVDRALASRNTVLTIRVNDECNRKMNMLVDAGLFKSRSESAAFLIHEGIKNQDALFNKISARLDKIEKIREELKKVVSEEFSSSESEKR